MGRYHFNLVLKFLLTNFKPSIFYANNSIIEFNSTVLMLKKFVIFTFMLFICLVDDF